MFSWQFTAEKKTSIKCILRQNIHRCDNNWLVSMMASNVKTFLPWRQQSPNNNNVVHINTRLLWLFIRRERNARLFPEEFQNSQGSSTYKVYIVKIISTVKKIKFIDN